MKLRVIFTMALALTVTVGTYASIPSSKSNKKSKKIVKVSKLTSGKVDTVNVKEFSYAMGAAQNKGLKTYLATNMGVDTTTNFNEFMRGLEEIAKNPEDKKALSYAAGVQIGQQVFGEFIGRINQQITGKQDSTYMDVETYKKGFMDAISGKTMPYSVDSATNIVNRQMKYYHDVQTIKEYGQNKKDGEDFLAQNRKLKDIKILPSGVQYKVIKEGTGAMPKADQTVKVDYEGRTIDGKVFDTSKGKKPLSISCSHVIKGWTDALTHMHVGSKWEIYIPQELAYGSREAGSIKPYSALIFTVELLDIEKAAPVKATTAPTKK